jgi:hypothetical protein
MTLNRRKLHQWIDTQMCTPPLANRFELFHEGRFGVNRICQLAFDEELAPDDAPSELERQVSETVGDHCDGFPGRQQYMVRAFSDEHPRGEFAFGMSANAMLHTGAAEAMGHEPPDMEAGRSFSHAHAQVSAQQMRHNEALMRGFVELAMSQRERDADIIAQQQQTIQKSQRQQMDVYSMIEDMLCRQQERRLVEAKYDKDEERKGGLMKRLDFIIPEIARRAGVPMMAKGDGGEGSPASTREMAAFFMDLSKEMQEGVLDALGDEKGLELLAMIKKIGTEDSGKEAEVTH